MALWLKIVLGVVGGTIAVLLVGFVVGGAYLLYKMVASDEEDDEDENWSPVGTDK